jgi:hypothetical protein
MSLVLRGTDGLVFPDGSIQPIASYTTASTKTGSYSIVASDINSIITVNGSFTLGHAITAAQAGSGFHYTIRNIGTATVTIDPAGSETIDGAATLKCCAKQVFDVVSDGVNWFTLGYDHPVVVLKFRANAPSINYFIMTLPPDYQVFNLLLTGVMMDSNANLWAQFDSNPSNHYYEICYSGPPSGTAPSRSGAYGAQGIVFQAGGFAGSPIRSNITIDPGGGAGGTPGITYISNGVFLGDGSQYSSFGGGYYSSGTRATSFTVYTGSGLLQDGNVTLVGYPPHG